MLSSELPSKGNLMATFIDKETKAQRGQVTCSGSHSQEEGERQCSNPGVSVLDGRS